eukprot:9926948-Ditylum_brightwellii.AAC.1
MPEPQLQIAPKGVQSNDATTDSRKKPNAKIADELRKPVDKKNQETEASNELKITCHQSIQDEGVELTTAAVPRKPENT